MNLFQISSYPSSPRYGKTKSGRKKMEINSSQEEKNISTIRVGERRKRAKKVFDPSDNNLPSKKRRAQKIANATGVKINNKKNNFPSTSSKQINNLTQKSKSESADSTDEEQHDNANFAPDMNDKIIGGVCSVCRQYQNSKDTHGKLIECKDCSNKGINYYKILIEIEMEI